jgi:hypothetical protein
VLVQGAAGAVSQALLALGKLAGLELWGTARGEHATLIRELGATPIDYQREDFTRVLPDGIDVVFDGVAEEGYRRSFTALKRGGLLCAYGYSAGVQAQRRMLTMLMWIARLYLWRWLPGGKRAGFYSINVMRARHPAWFLHELERLFGLLATGALRPRVAERISFDEVTEAHRRLEAGGLAGKLVLCPTSRCDSNRCRLSASGSPLPSTRRLRPENRCYRLIAHDWATLIPHPIGEAEVVYADVVKSGADRCGCAQRRSSAALAMGDDVVARAEACAFQDASQRRCRTNNAIVQQIGMRQVPGTGEMPAASTVARVLSGELGARTGVEDIRVAVKLTLEGLAIDQTYGPSAGNGVERAFRRPGARRQSGRCGKCGPSAIQDDGLGAKILEDEPNARGVGHLAAIVGHGDGRRIDTERPERVIPIRGLVKSYVGRLGRRIPFIDRHAHRTGGVAGVERCPIARIEIAYWTERGECSDIDEGIVRHGEASLAKAGCDGFSGKWRPRIAPRYWMGISSSRAPGPAVRFALTRPPSCSRTGAPCLDALGLAHAFDDDGAAGRVVEPAWQDLLVFGRVVPALERRRVGEFEHDDPCRLRPALEALYDRTVDVLSWGIMCFIFTAYEFGSDN